MKSYFVYIMANGFGNVLYLGVTNNIERRVYEHKNGRREKKDNLIKNLNPDNLDLSADWYEISHPFAKGSK